MASEVLSLGGEAAGPAGEVESLAGQVLILTGEVEGLNFGADGLPVSVMLRIEGGLVQVNFPRRTDPAFACTFEEGRVATVEALASDRDCGRHPIFEMVAARRIWTGRVKRIGFARDGEPNGAILESGEFVYLKPSRAREAALAIGDELAVEGTSFVSEIGQVVIEPETLNGHPVGRRKKKG